MVKKLNHWGRLLFTDKILTDPLVRSEIDRLRAEDEQAGVMTQRQRRQKLKVIADTTEHPTRGFTDHIKAMELDAKLDGSLTRASDNPAASSDAQRAPALNLFFLNTAEVKPAAASAAAASANPINQLVIDVPPAEEPVPDDLL